jgi:hypothetical protein
MGRTMRKAFFFKRRDFQFDAAKKEASIGLSLTNTKATASAAGTSVSAMSLDSMNVGVVFKATINQNSGSGTWPAVGIGPSGAYATGDIQANGGIMLLADGGVYFGGGSIGSTGWTFTNGDVIRVKPVSSTQVQFSKNGGAYSTSFTHAIAGAQYAGVTLRTTNDAVTGAWD